MGSYEAVEYRMGALIGVLFGLVGLTYLSLFPPHSTEKVIGCYTGSVLMYFIYNILLINYVPSLVLVTLNDCYLVLLFVAYIHHELVR